MLTSVFALYAGAILASAIAAVSRDSEVASGSDFMPGESAAQRDARMAWWREARFGMFIHWGLYALPAGEWNGVKVPVYAEWLMHEAKVPVAEYAPLAPQFNPIGFDADQWVCLAKGAGMKYIIITAKHHDGFAMFRSAASRFNIVDATPFKRDPLKELAEACTKHGVRLGFYYSQNQDWSHPGGDCWHIPHWDKAQDGDYDDYLNAIVLPQIRELFTRYGKVSVLWFDTPSEQMTRERGQRFLPLLDLQPGIIVNDRLGGGFKGDTETPEQYIPANGYPGRDWETCMTINDSWGYRAGDDTSKPFETLLRNLIDIASKGGNYLLNIGPDATGTIPPSQVERLQQIGQWLAVNGEAIYGTGPTPFGAEAGRFSETERDDSGKPVFKPEWKWRCTTKPGELFIHLFEWPTDGRLELPAVQANIFAADLLADPSHAALTVQQHDQRTVISGLPASALDATATVLRLKTEPLV